MVSIIDYGMGNLRSVQKAFETVGASATIVSDPDLVAKAERLVLPGVGAMADAMQALRDGDLIEPIRDFLSTGRPFLGICLGLQMLFDVSYENGEHPGLGVFPGKVVRFEVPRPLKVPHMGWNSLQWVNRPPIADGLDDDPYVYFVHSYHVEPEERSIVAAEADYGAPFTAMVWKDNIIATQFHPEKSQRVGLTLLKNFTRSAVPCL